MPTNCTIAVDKKTRSKLQDLKLIESESYDAVLNRLLDEIKRLRHSQKKKRGPNQKLEA